MERITGGKTMTLKEWFNESEKNIQAIRWGRNGRKYIYTRSTRSEIALNRHIEEVVKLSGGIGYGAWIER